jgi:hypothetical protein
LPYSEEHDFTRLVSRNTTAAASLIVMHIAFPSEWTVIKRGD